MQPKGMNPYTGEVGPPKNTEIKRLRKEMRELKFLVETVACNVGSDTEEKVRKLASDIGKLRMDMQVLLRFAREVEGWREACWAYDDDMGNRRRKFIDEEEWDILEERASNTLKLLQRDKHE